MPKCPKCNAEIDQLRNICRVQEIYTFCLDEEGIEDYDFQDTYYSSRDSDSYNCPMCQEELFNNEEEAIAFLKGN